MYRLIYISTAQRETTQDHIDQILAVSRINNCRDGLTGLLIYDGKRFFQYIEGEEARVRTALTRIKADPRHRGLVELSSSTGQNRQFPNWEMAGMRADSPAALETIVADLTQSCDTQLAAQLVGFAQVRGSKASAA